MSEDNALDKLRDAVQEYLNYDEDVPLVVTDFAVVYAAVDMHTADTRALTGFATGGALHASLGLAHILVRELEAPDTEGDDE